MEHNLSNGDPKLSGGLTERGRDQAAALGRRLAGETIDLCLTSEFLRARQTAEIALRGRDVRQLIDPNLDDLHFGSFEGRPIAEYHAWMAAHGPDARLPGHGESIVEAVVRICRALAGILARREETLFVVSHSMPVTYIVNASEGKPPAPLQFHVECGVPYPLGRAEVLRALEILESWTAGRGNSRKEAAT